MTDRDESQRMTLRERAIEAIGLRRPRDWVMIACAFAGGMYLMTSFVPQAILYIQLKSGASGVAHVLREARWTESALACPGDGRVGTQIDRLFENGFSVYLARVRWVVVPPRFELYVTGTGTPSADFAARHILMSIDVDADGWATLTAATIAGERGQLANAKLWVVAACKKPPRR